MLLSINGPDACQLPQHELPIYYWSPWSVSFSPCSSWITWLIFSNLEWEVFPTQLSASGCRTEHHYVTEDHQYGTSQSSPDIPTLVSRFMYLTSGRVINFISPLLNRNFEQGLTPGDRANCRPAELAALTLRYSFVELNVSTAACWRPKKFPRHGVTLQMQ